MGKITPSKACLALTYFAPALASERDGMRRRRKRNLWQERRKVAIPQNVLEPSTPTIRNIKNSKERDVLCLRYENLVCYSKLFFNRYHAFIHTDPTITTVRSILLSPYPLLRRTCIITSELDLTGFCDSDISPTAESSSSQVHSNDTYDHMAHSMVRCYKLDHAFFCFLPFVSHAHSDARPA